VRFGDLYLLLKRVGRVESTPAGRMRSAARTCGGGSSWKPERSSAPDRL